MAAAKGAASAAARFESMQRVGLSCHPGAACLQAEHQPGLIVLQAWSTDSGPGSSSGNVDNVAVSFPAAGWVRIDSLASSSANDLISMAVNGPLASCMSCERSAFIGNTATVLFCSVVRELHARANLPRTLRHMCMCRLQGR